MKNRSPKSLTPDESSDLLEQLLKHKDTDRSRSTSQRNYLAALLMLDAGLRVGELLQLTVGDLVIQNQPVRSLLVRSQIAKCHSERHVKVTARLHAAIDNANVLIWLQDDRDPASLAFYSVKRHETLSYQRIEQILAEAALKSCHRHVHPHMLRHTFATNLMRVAPMRVVQELLGHTRMNSTSIYMHPDQTDQDKAIDRLPAGE